jgi:hypothetical protein
LTPNLSNERTSPGKPGSASHVLFVVTSILGLSSCSSQQLYAAGQEWKKTECNRITDLQERNRCMSSTKTSFEDYKPQTDAAKGEKSSNPSSDHEG